MEDIVFFFRRCQAWNDPQKSRLILHELVHDPIQGQKIDFGSLRVDLAGDGISRRMKLKANEWGSVSFYAYLHPRPFCFL